MDEASACLSRIHRSATLARNDAGDVRRNVRMLKAIPGFETRAQDMIKRAKVELMEALSIIDQAETEYTNKPTQ